VDMRISAPILVQGQRPRLRFPDVTGQPVAPGTPPPRVIS
jgi:hypothetical protein